MKKDLVKKGIYVLGLGTLLYKTTKFLTRKVLEIDEKILTFKAKQQMNDATIIQVSELDEKMGLLEKRIDSIEEKISKETLWKDYEDAKNKYGIDSKECMEIRSKLIKETEAGR